jgi:hypothetical protein
MKYALAIVQLAFGLGLFLCVTVPRIPTAVVWTLTAAITTGKLAVITVTEGRSPVNRLPSQDEMLRKLANKKPVTDANKKEKQ